MDTPKNPFHPAEQSVLFALAEEGMICNSDLDKWLDGKRITHGQYSDFFIARRKKLNELGLNISVLED